MAGLANQYLPTNVLRVNITIVSGSAASDTLNAEFSKNFSSTASNASRNSNEDDTSVANGLLFKNYCS